MHRADRAQQFHIYSMNNFSHILKRSDPRRLVRASIAIFAFSIAPACMAEADPIVGKLKATLQSRLENMKIENISKSPISGVFEVRVDSHILYSDANGDYLVTGDMINAKTKENLTKIRLSEINRIDFSELPLKNAIKFTKGDGNRKIAIFSDPHCVHCKKFESTLDLIDNVTVYTFIYPVLSPDSIAKSKAIWCSTDQQKAWREWMQSNIVPTAPRSCDTTAIKQNIALGDKFKVEGTPVVFLANGRRLQGAVPADMLNKELTKAR